MRSRLQGTVSILALLVSSLSPVSAQAQEKQHDVYSVKYVCGVNENPLNSTSAIAAAGAYKTDINIQRAWHAGEARITVLPSVGRSLASEGSGRTGRSQSTTLVGAEVVTVICQDINDLIDDALTLQFRVGFLRIDSFEPLSVVAVYTAKHCRSTVGSDFLRNTVCDGDTALDVVRYDSVLVEAIEKDDSKGPD
jgi:hypothetical protein